MSQVPDQANFDVVRVVAPVRRRLGGARAWTATQHGAIVGAVVGLAVLLVARAYPFAWAIPLALVCLAVAALAGLAAGLSRWPASIEAARLADSRLDLDDRLTTALELQGRDGVFCRLQRSDAAARIRGVPLRNAGKGLLHWHDSAVTGLALVLLAALVLIGGTPRPAAASKSGRADQARIRQAALDQLPQIVRAVRRGLTSNEQQDPAMRQLLSQLARLRSELLHSTTRSRALRSISVSQQQISRSLAGLHVVDPASIASLSHALSPARAQQDGQQERNASDASATARTVRTVAGNLTHMTARQRSLLARTLARAVNTAPDASLRGALRKAASALASNDPQLARNYLRQASRLLSSTSRSQRERSRLQLANRQLESLKSTVSGVHNRSTPRPPNGASANRPPGSKRASGAKGSGRGNSTGTKTQGQFGTKPGQGTTSSRGSGPSSSRVRGNGSSSTNGVASAVASRRSGQGGVNNIARRHGGAAKRGQGKYALVYVPGLQGKGPHTIRTDGSTTPGHGRLVPYQEVIVQYSSAARGALNRTSLPPSLQTYVRRYFVALSQ